MTFLRHISDPMDLKSHSCTGYVRMPQRHCSNLIHHWTERVICICVAAPGDSYCLRGQVENLVAFQATGTFVVCLINLETRANLNLVAFDAVFPTIFISNPQNYSGLINQQSQLNISDLLGV